MSIGRAWVLFVFLQIQQHRLDKGAFMSKDNPTPMPRDLEGIAKQLGNAEAGSATAFDVKGSEGHSEQLVDAIEMIGEEQAAQLPPPRDDGISPGMRYLHSSRTIHQLVTDRNR